MKKKSYLLPALLAILIIGLIIGFARSNAGAPQQTAVQPAADGGAALTLIEPDDPPTAQPAETPAPTEKPVEPPAPSEKPAETPTPTEKPAETPTPTEKPAVAEDGKYDSKDDVALYLHIYGHLPSNFVTKSAARKAGWSGGSLDPYFPGCSIGGDVFQNREESLPSAPGRTYYECDIGTTGRKSRGAKRIVFSNDGLIYYTNDHYDSFTLLSGEYLT